MANERAHPCLPCADIDESIAFYTSLGFERTYYQLRPNTYGIVALGDLHIHLFGIEGFIPADSYGTVIIQVPDPDGLYAAFAARLRETYGKLPVAGIPRILRPRKKYGTVTGFNIVDPGGNWLRFYKLDEVAPEDSGAKVEGLAQIINVAARLGDAKGDEMAALKTLENGLARYANADALDLVRAHLYRAELAVRTDNLALAQESLAAAMSIELPAGESATVADELAHVQELVNVAS